MINSTQSTQGFLIKCKVQRAGFRSKIKDMAKAHKLTGFAKNLQNYDEDVLVVCEGDNEKINGFLSDVDKLKSMQVDVIRKKEELENKISTLNEELDKKLISDDNSDPDRILMLLERKKSRLRELKFYESGTSPYFIKDIAPVEDINKYKKEIREADYGNNFLIVRNIGEESDRLDEGIEALVDLRYSTSNLNYDIIDVDFAILNIKYGALTGAVKSGFEAFPREFAKAFDGILDKKYGIKPKT